MMLYMGHDKYSACVEFQSGRTKDAKKTTELNSNQGPERQVD